MDAFTGVLEAVCLPARWENQQGRGKNPCRTFLLPTRGLTLALFCLGLPDLRYPLHLRLGLSQHDSLLLRFQGARYAPHLG